MKRTILFSILGISASVASVHGAVPVNVNIHNGNVYFSEADYSTGQGTLPLEVVRNYNSRSLYDGAFGFGWSSIFETHFEVTPEGNIWMKEVGGGDTVLLTCSQFKPSDLNQIVDKMVTHLQNDPNFKNNRSETFWAQKRQELMSDINARLRVAREMSLAPKGMNQSKIECRSTQKGLQVMRRIAGGWVRTRGVGHEERFDMKGRLIGMRAQTGEMISFIRNKVSGLVEEAKSKGVSLSFKYNKFNKVAFIKLPGGKTIEYKYKEVPMAQQLVEVTGAGVASKYEYTQGTYLGDYNIRLVDTGKDKTVLKYDLQKDLVSQIDDPDGTVRTFEYFLESGNAEEHYGTRVKYVKAGKTVVDSKFEYWWKQKADGTKYIYQTEKVENSEKIKTIYSACCSLPLEITKNGKTTTFSYTDDGLLTKKVKPDGSQIELTYGEQRKVTKVIQALAGKAKMEFEYSYNKLGDLARAAAKDGRWVTLGYDSKRRMETIKGRDFDLIKFEFDQRDRPKKITKRDIGSVNVKYNAKTGEFLDVSTQAGAKIAYQLAGAFQTLMELITPATVPLTAD